MLDFWKRRAGFAGEAAQSRLAEVVCVLRHDGEVVGASSVVPTEVGLVASRRLFVFRCLLDEGQQGRYRDLVRATFQSLDSGSGDARLETEGLCLLLDAQTRRMHPEAVWEDIHMIYAGYLPDGHQVRVAYFSDQVSGYEIPNLDPDRPSPGLDYEIAAFDDQSVVSADDVVEAWVQDGALSHERAAARVPELLLVAIDADKRIAGMCTAYLARSKQVGAELWHFRAFVLSAHRASTLGLSLTLRACHMLEQRYITGADPRGIGIAFEVENEGLRSAFPKGRWRPLEFFLIGQTALGAHFRVRYFPGVEAPGPPALA